MSWGELVVVSRKGYSQRQSSRVLLVCLINDEKTSARVRRKISKGAYQETRMLARRKIAPFTIALHDELITDYVLDTSLVIDGRREYRTTIFDAKSIPLARNIKPIVCFGARVFVDKKGAAHLALPLAEPTFERRSVCIVVRRIRREIVIEGKTSVLWDLMRVMDGSHTTAEILSELRNELATDRLLADLAAVGAVDLSGRPMARLLHTATKKGVLPGGGLEVGDVLRLVTDGNYREYPRSRAVRVHGKVSKGLLPFHKITRLRRSFRDYNGKPIARADFESLLTTACGVTGSLKWAGREIKLRAYPSSGGLYSVEVYPVVFAVKGLQAAVYHYHVPESKLELVRKRVGCKSFLDAALPEEREMLAGVAVMICLSGVFPRHEIKYGEGGYRMMVAEAGHISQNLILAATALGLHARPFGGVFDYLLNSALGFKTEDEQFLLSVIIGYTGEKA